MEKKVDSKCVKTALQTKEIDLGERMTPKNSKKFLPQQTVILRYSFPSDPGQRQL